MILERKAGRLLVKAYETRAEMGRAAAAEAAQETKPVGRDCILKTPKPPVNAIK